MKVKKGAVISVIIVLLLIGGGFYYSLQLRNRARTDLARQIVSDGGGRWARPDSVEELRRSIATYERRIQRYVQTAARRANYWKLLGLHLQQRGLHEDALQAFQRAIDLLPEDAIVHHHTGVSAAIRAKSFHIFPGREAPERVQHFELAEQAFLRAIDLDDRYTRPRYSLGVLYVFDLNRPEDAIEHLQRVLEVSRGDLEAMFVLARAFYMTDNFRSALELFDRIIATSQDERTRASAQNNREAVLRRIHG
ncbi:MAG: tetratricopeptide repeat protein [Treponema sp.]|nr:tetratricopeptide repeat protein [Treponema sp.]